MQLTSAEIARIQSKVLPGSGVGKYAAAYREVLKINREHKATGLPDLGSEGEYWFARAAEINENSPKSEANAFIRGVTRSGLEWDGKSASVVQANSNAIGLAVITDIVNSGAVPPISQIITNDAGKAVAEGGQTLGGWGGSFYYWNTPYGVSGATVGQIIQGDLLE